MSLHITSSFPWMLVPIISLSAMFVGCGGSIETLSGENVPVDSGISEDGGQQEDAGTDTSSGDDGSVDAPVDSPVEDVGIDTPQALCEPPTDPSNASLCISAMPEKIKLIPMDGAFDGKGIFLFQVFDQPNVGSGASEIDPIASSMIPPQGNTSAKIYDPREPQRFELPAGDVFVRVLFVDNYEAFNDGEIHPGVWVGGYDLSNGLADDLPLMRVHLTAGLGHDLSVPLIAMRKISVELEATNQVLTNMKGDGQGPGGFMVLGQQTIQKDASMFGYGESNCYDLTNTYYYQQRITGITYGAGERWIFAWVDDFGTSTPNQPAPGTFSNLQPGIYPPKINVQSKVVVPPDAYFVRAKVPMTVMAPGNPPTYDNAHCY